MTAAGFEERVRAVVLGVRPGEVVTYGEVAEEAGYPGAARAVGRVMATTDGLPWWRVVAANGRLVPGHEAEHARRLEAEGVPVEEAVRRVRRAALARRQGSGLGNPRTRPTREGGQIRVKTLPTILPVGTYPRP